MTQAEQHELEDIVSAEIIPLRLAITAMRDSGYKNTAYALAELIDNAIQANATTVEVLCIERKELVSTRERRRLYRMAVLDNGSGMDALTLRKALQFGNGTRLNDRSGIGRFGMGLPNASISQTRRVDVWSWQNGPTNAIHTYIDLGEIGKGSMRDVPEPQHESVPDDWGHLSQGLGQSGTLVVWSDLDLDRLTWKSATHTLHNTERLVGRIYRRFIMEGVVTIRLFAKEEGSDKQLHDREAVFDDPLYLTSSPAVPAPFNDKPMFEHVFDDPQKIEYGGHEHTVNIRYSVATQDTIKEAGTQDRGRTNYGKHAAGNIGVSVLRAGREIMLDQGWCIGYDPRERWWGAEVEFPPALDELFGVTNNKQAATHFSELATTEWEQLAEEGEQFIDVVNRLKEDGDPRGWLLTVADSIKRNLEQIRKALKAQGAGRRSTRRNRHGEADDVTTTVNKGWKERSKEKPIEGEDQPTTEQDLEEIRSDLTENKNYDETDAEDLVSLIQDADLRVIFLEADFTNAYELFNVEMKGNVTEVTFNRQHPVFDDIFGTVATVDEDVADLSNEEILQRLLRAVNAAKITFAAWARYEREAGISRAQALQKVRFDWGQIAAKFLQPEDDLDL
ncbi:MAG: ATP-binding protein [Magnetococcales bacterium]|nr:ATP-binding protein [Magnetococcales bacterium]